MADIGLGTLYDMNKSAMMNESKLSKHQIKNKFNEIIKPYVLDTNNTYYMMLCNETRDYTVLSLTSQDNIDAALNELRLCLEDRGEVYSIEKDENGGIEIWIKGIGFMPLIEKDMFYCYYFFPYDTAILKF